MPTITLRDLAHAFLADDANLAEHRKLSREREATLPQLQAIIRNFVNGNTSIQTFRDEFSKIINPHSDPWFAQGRFRMELNKFIKNHTTPGTTAETTLRSILSGLNGANMGQRIEHFYTFTLAERERLRNLGISGSAVVAPGNSALIISLFAIWLDPHGGKAIIYNRDMREGLCRLYKEGLLKPLPSDLKLNINGDVVDVNTNADHQAFIYATNQLLQEESQLKIDDYWADSFLFWSRDYFRDLAQTTKDIDDNKIFSPTPPQTSIADERVGRVLLSSPPPPDGLRTGQHANYQARGVLLSPPPPEIQFLKNDPLAPTPELLLTERIHEVQRRILVEESVIRRIYHALLAGHVVLSGPPGTGKTELARLLPEILWRTVEDGSENNSNGNASPNAYTTRLVTATDEWSVRTLISGIAPVSKNGNVAYKIQYGHLTSAILKNWSAQGETPEKWSTLTLRRTPVTSNSGVERGTQQTFRGQWLIIDEFNRAPIDLALGEALTALGGNDVLRVMTEDGSMELPIPKDFRVIGTLNSFDRNYLNQISEALKRRFSFVEILPPGRSLREAEQAIVLYKALERVSHLSKEIVAEENEIAWNTLGIEANPDDGQYAITWPDESHPFREAFEAAWRVFETIRVYRQLGTAQAIGLVRHMLIAGILQNYTTREQWIGEALDAALCDTIADQLQVLLPDEIETLLLALTSERAAFSAAYHRLLANLSDRQQRLYGQLLALGRVSDEHGVAYLSDEEIEASAQSNPPTVAETKLRAIFHLDAPLYRLPQFTRRLRAFKAERGL